MDKQTTAQVAKALNITKQKIHKILQYSPHLRPREQGGPVVHYLWSEEEIAALRAHLAAHPRISIRKRSLTGYKLRGL
jgi:hypothetical protein